MLPLDVGMMIQHRARNCEMEFAWWFWLRWLHIGGGGREGERGRRKFGRCGVGCERFCWFRRSCGDLSGFGGGYGSFFSEGFKTSKCFFYREALCAWSSGLFEFFLGFVIRCLLSEWMVFLFDCFRIGLLFFLFICRHIFRQR